MEKMRLELEKLAVESFDTWPEARGERGTVRGHDSATGPEEPDTIVATCGCPPPNTAHTACGQFTCGQFTCGWTCDAGCTGATCGGATCNHTCPNTCFICGPEDPR